MQMDNAQKLSTILSGKENEALNHLTYNMLECEEAIQLCRPIPVRSLGVHYEGQIKFNTINEYVEIHSRPDPFNFVEITTQIGAATSLGHLATENFGALVTNDREGAGATKRQVCYQLPLALADGDFLRPVFGEYDPTTVGALIYFGAGTAQLGACGYHGFTIDAGSTITYAIINNGPVNAQVSVELFKWNTATRAATVIVSGTAIVASANAAAAPTATIPGATTFTQDECLILGLGIVSAGVAGTSVKFKDLEMGISSTTGFSISNAYSTTVYTLGEAVYGKTDPRAQTLDDFFTKCLLWAPVGLSGLLNVRQQLNDAGGFFLSAELPSFVTNELSPIPSKAWQDIVAYGRSYPVKDCLPFRTGCHASWMPARLDDWDFRAPFKQTVYKLREEAALPSIVLLGQKASADASAKYLYDFNVNFEIQSLNPLVTMKLGPSSPSFASQFLALVAASDALVGENPSHIERLKKLAKKIANDPHIRAAAKWSLYEGVPLLAKILKA